MLVYGDHVFEGQLQALRTQLCTLASQALEEQNNLDLLRTLLILCGQVEQGVHDALSEAYHADVSDPMISLFHLATAQAAEAFYSHAYQQPLVLPLPVIETAAALRNLLQTLNRIHSVPDMTLTIKVPEGFSIYALYPEQYLVAAAQWLAEHSAQQEQGAVVVGIRSIGTTLAAVVATALRAAGWEVQSLTVRPTGHPFSREVDLGLAQIDPTRLALIVDEGPGISGSSMAAAASALAKIGFARHNIAFFPGHANAPAGAGAEEVQRWWQTTPRYVADVESVAFNGLSLHEVLASTLPQPVTQIEDLSNGGWRHDVYPNSDEWPALCTAFERIKYRYTLQSGKRVLFKFLGLATMSPDLSSTAAAVAKLLRGRAAEGLAPPILAVTQGFVATEWIEGVPVTPGELAPHLIDAIGRYIARVARKAMPRDESHKQIESLAEMLFANTHESLGEEAAHRTRVFTRNLQSVYDERDYHERVYDERVYGDGHMQPYEWICTDNGLLFKVDSVGHDCDHTLIGRQSVAWDLAGAIVEWRLEGEAVDRLLHAYSTASGTCIDSGLLNFYRAAYLAFRIGQCTMAAQVHDPDERSRLLKATSAYRQQLAEFLGIETSAQAT